jgi:hypothetical protein
MRPAGEGRSEPVTALVHAVARRLGHLDPVRMVSAAAEFGTAVDVAEDRQKHREEAERDELPAGIRRVNFDGPVVPE